MAIITQTKAAKEAGVTKQAIGGIKDKGTYNFFVESTTKAGKPKLMVDTDHHHWDAYKREAKDNKNKTGSKYGKNNELKPPKPKIEPKVDKEKPVDKKKNRRVVDDNDNNGFTEKEVHSLTGGIDPSSCELRTTADVKRMTEITKMTLEMRIKLNEYVKREIMDHYLDLISHNIAAVFVNLGRTVSEDICTELERIGFERKVEEIVSRPVARGIEDIQKACADGKKLRILK